MSWRQADALQEAGIDQTHAVSTLLTDIESGAFQPTRNTVLVLDEASQIGPRDLLKLLEFQARTGMTIKMLRDREQAQSIEAGDSVEILRRALPPEALPELLTTVRQATKRAWEIAALFREGEAATGLAVKRADGHAMLAGGDRDQVVAQIADLYIARHDILLASGSRRGITVSAPTNDDVGEISQAIRARLKARGEIAPDETLYPAVDQRGREYDLALAVGDRVRLFRRTWGKVNGKEQQVGNNGDVVEIRAKSAEGLRIRTKAGDVADVEWRRLAADQAGGAISRAGQGVAGRLGEAPSGRLLLGFGHALTIDAAQGITSDEHINALPRGTAGVTGFTTYVAESRSRGTTWTVVSEGALYDAERHGRRSATTPRSPLSICGTAPQRTCPRNPKPAEPEPIGVV